MRGVSNRIELDFLNRFSFPVMKRFGVFIALLLFTIVHVFGNTAKKQIRVRIIDSLSTVYDETNIYLDLGSTSAYIYPEDGQKIVDTSSGAPYIYSYSSDGVPCFSNSYGNFSQSVIIPLGFRVGAAGTFQFVPTMLDNFDGTTIIRLEDRTLGIFYDLRQGGFTLNFNQALTDNGRFFVHVSYPTQISLIDAGCNNDNGMINLTQDNDISWNVCALYDDNMNLLSSYTNINGAFDFSSLTEGNYNLLFGYGVYTFIKPVILSGHQVLVNAGASKYYAGVNEIINFSVLATNTSRYIWDFGDGTLITGVVNANYSFPDTGNYLITVSCSNIYGCSATDTFTVHIETSLGVSPLSKESIAIITENKTLHIINLKADRETDLEIYNTVGDLLLNRTLTSSSSTLDLSNLSAGIYIVKAKTMQGNFSQKVFLH